MSPEMNSDTGGVERRSLLDAIETARDRSAVVVLHGAAGTGKTVLAQQYTRRCMNNTRVGADHVIWHSIENPTGGDDLGQIITHIGRRSYSLAFAGLSMRQRTAAVTILLRQRRTLVILDGFEGLGVDPEAPHPDHLALRAFLADLATAQATVLITSHHREHWLGTAVERVHVPGFTVAEARAYLARLRADDRQPEPVGWEGLVHHCEGNPLALRLLAAQLPHTPAERILDEIRSGASHTVEDSVPACAEFAAHRLPEFSRRLLSLARLVDDVLDADLMSVFSASDSRLPTVFRGIGTDAWLTALDEAVRAGFATELEARLFSIHPALSAFFDQKRDSATVDHRHDQRTIVEYALMHTYAYVAGELAQGIADDGAEIHYYLLDAHQRTFRRYLDYALDHHHWNHAAHLLQALTLHWRHEQRGEQARVWIARTLSAVHPEGNDPPPLDTDKGRLWLSSMVADIEWCIATADFDIACARSIVVRDTVMLEPGSPTKQNYLAAVHHLIDTIAHTRRDQFGAEQSSDRFGTPETPAHTTLAVHLSAQLIGRYETSREPAELHVAIALLRNVIADSAAGPSRGRQLMLLSSALASLFFHTRHVPLLHEAVEHSRRAVAELPDNTLDQCFALAIHGRNLKNHAEQTRQISLLEEAVETIRVAVSQADRQAASPMVAMMARTDLAKALRALFTLTQAKDTALLQEAITVSRRIMATSHHDHPDHPTHVLLSCSLLTLHFERTGHHPSLDEAIRTIRRALSITSPTHRDRAALLGTLAEARQLEYESRGNLSALTAALGNSREAVSTAADDDPGRYRYSSLVVTSLLRLYERAPRSIPIDDAIDAARRAVPVDAPHNRADRAVALHNLGLGLQHKYAHERHWHDLAEAIDCAREALAATTPEESVIAPRLNTLGMALSRAFRHTADPSYLHEAVECGRAATAAIAADHPYHLGYQLNLATSLDLLYDYSPSPALLHELRQRLSLVAQGATTPAPLRMQAFLRLGSADIRAEDHASALRAAEAAVGLLPQLAPREWSRLDREYSLAGSTGMTSQVAAITVAAGQPERAVELIEQSRGLFTNEVIDDRRVFGELHRIAPELGIEFDRLRHELAAPDHHSPNSTRLDPSLSDRWSALLARIRATAGLDDFLTPPTIDWLRHHAGQGPIVLVYSSTDHGAALIVSDTSENPVAVVTLPALTDDVVHQQIIKLWQGLLATEDGADLAAVLDAQQHLHEVLEWLWDTVTAPVLTHLGTTAEPDPRTRIWWSPIGALQELPLHAAGYHTHPGHRTVLDHVVSSYTPTIRALDYARTRPAPSNTPADSTLIVTMPDTPEAEPLRWVDQERKALGQLLPHHISLNGPQATHHTVVDALTRHRIVHFACHAEPDFVNPAASRLLLHDHAETPLTVAELGQLDLPDAELAYLSACATSQTSAQLIDETIQLSAAIHLAGFRHVIGTLWYIGDKAAAELATEFYHHLTANGTEPPDTAGAATALNHAVRRQRERDLFFPSRWAAHHHYGI